MQHVLLSWDLIVFVITSLLLKCALLKLPTIAHLHRQEMTLSPDGTWEKKKTTERNERLRPAVF